MPEEVFQAAKRVIDTRGVEVVSSPKGLFIVKFSENGPFTTKFSDEWEPVYVARIARWSSGGIKKNEFSQWESEHEDGSKSGQARS